MDALVFGCLVQPADSPGHSAAHRFAIDRDAWRYKGDRACGNDDVLGCDCAAHIHTACKAMTAIDTYAQSSCRLPAFSTATPVCRCPSPRSSDLIVIAETWPYGCTE